MYTAAANLKTEPWPHQQEAIDFVRDKPGAMLAIEMGAGKSLCNIALMNELECQRTLIVCPLSIVDHVWPAQILTHSADSFDIDSASGQIQTKSGVTYDHESKSSYSVTVKADDNNGGTAAIDVTITVADVNEPPEFDSATAAREVPENTEAGVAIGAPVTANDPDTGNIQTYTLEGADADSFDIDSVSGQIQTKSGVTYDHESKSSYSVTVKADDNNGGTATIDVTITVADVNEPPEFDSATAAREVPENTEAGENIGAPVTAADPDTGDTLTYTLEGADADWFDIGRNTGQIKVGTETALDYEVRASYTVSVTAADPSGSSAAIGVTIAVFAGDLGELGSRYDTDNDKMIGRDEAITAIIDYFAERITRDELLGVITLYIAS